MEETREQRIARLPEEFRKLLEEKLPEKGSSMQRIEGITEEIGREIEQRMEAYVPSGLAKEPELAPERLYITVDGAMVPMKDGWRECKVGAAYEASTSSKGDVVARNIERVGVTIVFREECTLRSCSRQ